MAGISGMGTPDALKKPEDLAAQSGLDNALNVQLPNVPAQQAQPDTQEMTADELLASLNQPDQLAQGQQEMSADELLGALNAQPANADTSTETYDQTAPTLSEQIDQAPVRFKASFARNASQKQYVLEQTYGAGNVKKNGDEFLVKRDNKWKKFDSDSFELIGDVLDWAQPALEEVFSSGATAAGLAAAGVETAATMGVGAPAAPGIVGAARAAGAATGVQAADAFGEYLGVPTTLNRGAGQRAMELSTAALSAGVFGRLADNVGEWLTRKAAGPLIENFDETLKQETKVLTDAATELNNAGIISPVNTGEGSPILALPQQIQPSNPELQKTAKLLTEDKEFQRVQNSFMQMVENMATKVKAALLPEGTELDNTNLGGKVAKYAKELKNAEGKQIEIARKSFSEQVKDSTVVIEKTKEKIGKLAADYGLEIGGRPDVDRLVVDGLADEHNAKKVSMWIGTMNEYINLEKSGRVRPKELDELYTRLQRAINWDKTDDVGNETLKDLWRAVRDDYTENILTWADAGKLKGINGKSYAETLKRYRDLSNVSKDLKSVLINPASGEATMTADALAQGLFTGKASGKNINAFKLLTQDDPELFNQVRGAYMDKILRESQKVNRAGDSYTSVVAFADKLLAMPPEIREHIVGDEKAQRLLKAARTYASRIQANTPQSIAADDKAKKGIAQLATFLTNYAANKVMVTYDWATRLMQGEKSAITQYLTQSGQEEILKLVPVNKRGAVSEFLNTAIKKQEGFNSKLANYAERANALGLYETGKAVGKQAAKTAVGQKVRGTSYNERQ